MRRELAYYFLFAALTVCSLLTVAAVGWAALPRPEYISIGSMSDFPPQAIGPHVINTERVTLYVVNAGDDLIVLDGRSTTQTRCEVKWVPTNHRFEDPCCGSKFELDGSYIEGRATRDMDRYEVKLKNGQVWVDLARPTPGAPRPTQVP